MRDEGLIDDPRAGLPPAGADLALYGTPVRPWPSAADSVDPRTGVPLDPPGPLPNDPIPEPAARRGVATRAALVRAAKGSAKAARALRRWSALRWRGWSVFVLDLAGLVLFVIGAFKVWEPLGYFMAGSACLFLGWVLDSPEGSIGRRRQ